MNPLQVIDFHFLNICLNQSRGVYTCFVLASFARKGLCYEHVHTWMEKQATWEKRGKRQQHRLSKVTTWMTKRDPRQEYFKQLHYWHIWPQWSFREQMTLVGRVLVTSFRDAISRTYTDSATAGKKKFNRLQNLACFVSFPFQTAVLFFMGVLRLAITSGDHMVQPTAERWVTQSKLGDQ